MKVLMALLIVVVLFGCSKDPEWLYYGEVESVESMRVDDGDWLNGPEYVNTYTLTDGRHVVDDTNKTAEGFVDGGYLYGYRNDYGQLVFEIRPTPPEVK